MNVHGLNYQRAWKQFLAPKDCASLAMTNQTFAVLLTPHSVRAAAYSVPILQDEVSVVRSQLAILTDQNRRLIVKVQTLAAALEGEIVRRRKANTEIRELHRQFQAQMRERIEQIENLQRCLQWEIRCRVYLQDIATRREVLPYSWEARLRAQGSLF